MLKEHLLAINGILLSGAFIFFIYGTGALIVHGDWKLFAIAVGVFAFFIASEAILAIING